MSKKRRRADAQGRPEASTPGSRSGSILLAAVFLVVLNFATFAPLFEAGFVWDDVSYVAREPHVAAGLAPASIAWAMRSGDGASWDPVTRISHMVDVELFGLRPAGHHAVNLLLHIAVTLLFAWLLYAGTGQGWAAVLAAALFSVHPLRVEAVAWISARKDLLSTLFLLLTIGWYGQFVRGRRRVDLVLALAALAFGLMAKPMLVTVPALLLVVDFWPLRRWGTDEQRLPGRDLLIEKIPFAILAAAIVPVTMLTQGGGGALSLKLPLAVRVSNAVVSAGRYLLATVAPIRLAAFYPHPRVIEALPLALFASALGAAIVVAWFVRRRSPVAAAGWVWFLIALVPVSGLVQFGWHARADRFTYVPHLGLLVAIVFPIVALAGSRRTVVIGTVAVALLASAITTRSLLPFWTDDESLFRRALAVTDRNFLAHQFVGIAEQQRGDFESAKEHFRAAQAIDPGHAESAYNLGVLLLNEGRLDEAIEMLRRSLRLRPDFAEAHGNLSVALLARGDRGGASREAAELERLRPGSPEAEVLRQKIREAQGAGVGAGPAP